MTLPTATARLEAWALTNTTNTDQEQTMEHPILMSGTLVRATLSGAKTQTRRLITPLPEPPFMPQQSWGPKGLEIAFGPTNRREDGGPRWWRCPFGGVGDRLWVRETWACLSGVVRPGEPLAYRADTAGGERVRVDAPWRPSIHMPRWASRLTLEITEVRAQRLQDCSEEDARAEGVHHLTRMLLDATIPDDVAAATRGGARSAFAALWDTISGKRATWASNPWVWAITYRVVP